MTSAISPLVLSAHSFEGLPNVNHPGKALPARMVYDYELEFITDGTGSQIIDGVEHPVSPGDIVWRPPGCVTKGIRPYSCLAVVFDMEGVLRPGRDPFSFLDEKPVAPRFSNPLLDALPPLMRTSDPEGCRVGFQEILRHHANPGPASELALKGLVLQLLFRLAEDALNPWHREDDVPDGQGGRIRRLTRYIRRNFRQDLTLEVLSKEAELSPTYLHKMFREATGVTPLEYLTRVRIEMARELLATTNLAAARVAERCGVSNVPYFFTLFKKSTGLTPREFRARHRLPLV